MEERLRRCPPATASFEEEEHGNGSSSEKGMFCEKSSLWWGSVGGFPLAGANGRWETAAGIERVGNGSEFAKAEAHNGSVKSTEKVGAPLRRSNISPSSEMAAAEEGRVVSVVEMRGVPIPPSDEKSASRGEHPRRSTSNWAGERGGGVETAIAGDGGAGNEFRGERPGLTVPGGGGPSKLPVLVQAMATGNGACSHCPPGCRWSGPAPISGRKTPVLRSADKTGRWVCRGASS